MQTNVLQLVKSITLVLALGFCNSVSAQITPQNDCNDIAGPVCGSGTFTYTFGSGNDQDFTTGSGSNPTTNPAGFNSGCLLAGELNPMMVLINITSSGTLEWNFGNITGSSACQDWIMWPYTSSTCTQIAAGTLPPVACNWNGACSGLTGMATPVPAGANPADFQNELPVTAGQQFLLCISNYSGQTGTGALNFTGTAGVGCGSNVNICPGGSTLLNGTVPGGLSYTWSPATGLSSTTGPTVTASPAATTTYTVTIDMGAGVTQTQNHTVTVYTAPTMNFVATPETCLGDNDGSIVMNPVGAAPFTYTLNGVPQASNTFTGLGGGTYNVGVTDANGCVWNTSVTLAPGPVCCTMVLNTTSTQTTCPGACDGTANVNIAGAVGTPVITWMTGAGVPIGQTTPTATGLCAGNYMVEVTDPGQCTLTANVTVSSQPGITITTVTPVNSSCNGACDGTLTINAPTGVQYSVDGGTTFQASNIFNGLCAGTYNIIAENANGCQATTTATITQPAVLTVQVAPGGIINATCNGVANGALNMDVTGGTAPYAYAWNTTPVQNVQDATGLPAGNWCLSVTDANGCGGNACVTITEPAALTISFLVTDPSCYQYCDGNASVTPSGGTPPYTFDWNGIPGTNSTSTQANNLCDGVYDLIVTDALGCMVDTLDFPVTEPSQVQVGIVTPTNESCFQTCDGQIAVTSPAGVLFSIGGIFQPSPLFTGLCSGTYTVEVKDNNGCSSTATTSLIPQPEIVADFIGSPQPTDIYQTEINFMNTSVFASSYQWTFDSLGSSTATDPVFFFPDSGPGVYDVCLIASDANGCADTVCHEIVINDILYYYIPNAFTPDGNGLNDVFIPVLNNVDEEGYNFYVFTRWGEVVFHTTDINKGWDGLDKKALKGKSDTYVWKITGKNKMNAEKFEAYGHVNLLR